MRTSPWLVFTYSVIIVLGLLIALPNVAAAVGSFQRSRPGSRIARFPSASTFAAAPIWFSKWTRRI